MNLGQVMTRVSANVLTLDTTVQHNVPAFVQAAAYQLQLVHNFKCMQAEQQYVTPTQTPTQTHVLGQEPTNFKEVRGDPYFVRYDGSTQGILWAPSREYLYREYPPSDPNSIGEPRRLFLSEALSTTFPDPNAPDVDMTDLNIEVYPFPDMSSDWPDGDYRINVPYWAYMPSMVQATDTNWFCVNAIEFLVAQATSMCFETEMAFPAAQYWAAKAWGPKWDGVNYNTMGGWAKRVIAHDSGIVGQPAKVLRVRRDVFAGANQWMQ